MTHPDKLKELERAIKKAEGSYLGVQTDLLLAILEERKKLREAAQTVIDRIVSVGKEGGTFESLLAQGSVRELVEALTTKPEDDGK